MPEKKGEIDEQEIVENFLFPLWKSVSIDYKKKYARDVWDHFENALRSATNSKDLKKFLTIFKKRIPSSINKEDDISIMRVVVQDSDNRVLRKIRENTAYLVLMTRIINTEKK